MRESYEIFAKSKSPVANSSKCLMVEYCTMTHTHTHIYGRIPTSERNSDLDRTDELF